MSQKVEGDCEPLYFFLQRELRSGSQKATSSLWTGFQIHNARILNLYSPSQFTDIFAPPPRILYSKPFYWLFLSEELKKSIIVFISVLGIRKLELKYRVKIKVLLNLLT